MKMKLLLSYKIMLNLALLLLTACQLAATSSAVALVPPESATIPAASTVTPTPPPIPLALTHSPLPTATPWGGGTGKIAFLSDGIYMMNVECVNLPQGCGSGLIRLAENLGAISCFAWSPDGQKIVFKANRDIYVMDVAGNGSARLIADITPTDGDGDWYNCPAWLPDSQQFLVASAYDPSGVYRMGIDGSGMTRLPNASGGDHTWSPTGQHLLFTALADSHKPEIYRLNADGSNLTRLTHNTARDQAPVWSPDGQSIAFVSDRAVEDVYEIYLMNAGCAGPPEGCGQDPSQLSHTEGRYTAELAWSPDGRYLAYTTQRLDDNQWNRWIYLINTECAGQPEECDRGQTELARGFNPAWSPDSQQLIFADREFNLNVAAIGCINLPEGCDAHMTRLAISSTHTSPRSPAWQPHTEGR